MSKVKKRWKTYQDLIPDEDATPTQIKYKGKLITSPWVIANAYAEYLDKKIKDI